jgi:hypothetical protein
MADPAHYETPHSFGLLKNGGKDGSCCDYHHWNHCGCERWPKGDARRTEGEDVCLDPDDCECGIDYPCCDRYDGKTPGMKCLVWPLDTEEKKAKHIHKLRVELWKMTEERDMWKREVTNLTKLHDDVSTEIRNLRESLGRRNSKRALELGELEQIVKRIKNPA